MRTVIYDVPHMATVADTAEAMVRLVEKESRKTLGEDVQVVATHNGLEIGAVVGTSPVEIVDSWHEKRHARAVRDERLDPVRSAIRYLLSTISAEDRLLVVKELATDPLSKEGA